MLMPTPLQRIKGLTTGFLPTFVDIGKSFGGSVIVEDSLLHHAVESVRLFIVSACSYSNSNPKVAFVGDDTWLALFPSLLGHNVSYPLDPFDVEDLHTVDEGVIAHLPPIIEQNSHLWGLAIGYGLDVHHAGHRVGPDHPVMKAKLEQINNFLAKLAKVINEDTLLVYSATMVWIMEVIVFLKPLLPFGYTARAPRFPTRRSAASPYPTDPDFPGGTCASSSRSTSRSRCGNFAHHGAPYLVQQRGKRYSKVFIVVMMARS